MGKSTHLRLPLFVLLGCMALVSMAQPCDIATAPTGLDAAYTPGIGVLLQWDAIPASEGVSIRALSPDAAKVKRRLMGLALDQYLVPDAALSPGFYQWQVQVACSTVPPFDVTPVSNFGSFIVSSAACPATVVDIDGNTYQTVPIGAQCWLAENLRTSSYSNGDAIPTGLTTTAWASTSTGAFADYGGDTTYRIPYGLLYNWYAVDDARGVCPDGWHVPDDGEWDDLKLHLRLLGGPAGAKMKSTGTLGDGKGLWLAPNKGANNYSGFSGQPAGVRNYLGNYFGQGLVGIWWSATEASTDFAWIRFVSNDRDKLGRNDDIKEVGQSVRCVKD